LDSLWRTDPKKKTVIFLEVTILRKSLREEESAHWRSSRKRIMGGRLVVFLGVKDGSNSTSDRSVSSEDDEDEEEVDVVA
jgi:hypothetical protein